MIREVCQLYWSSPNDVQIPTAVYIYTHNFRSNNNKWLI